MKIFAKERHQTKTFRRCAAPGLASNAAVAALIKSPSTATSFRSLRSLRHIFEMPSCYLNFFWYEGVVVSPRNLQRGPDPPEYVAPAKVRCVEDVWLSRENCGQMNFRLRPIRRFFT